MFDVVVIAISVLITFLVVSVTKKRACLILWHLLLIVVACITESQWLFGFVLGSVIGLSRSVKKWR